MYTSIVLYMYTCVLSQFSHVQLFATLWTVAHETPLPWDSPGKNTGLGCHALFQGIFPIQGRTHVFYVSCIGTVVLYQLSHLENPQIS